MTPPNNGTSGVDSLPELGDSPSEFEEHDEPLERFTPSPELRRSLAEIKGQAQFLLYLADQIEESLDQMTHEAEDCHRAFLCRILGMYSTQLETKHQGLGEKIAEACQEVYVTIRQHEMG